MIVSNRVKPDPCVQNVTNLIICCFFSSDLSGNLITLNFALFTALQLRHFNQFVDLPIVYKSRHVSKQGRIRSEDSCGDPVIDSALLALEKFSKLKKMSIFW